MPTLPVSPAWERVLAALLAMQLAAGTTAAVLLQPVPRPGPSAGAPVQARPDPGLRAPSDVKARASAVRALLASRSAAVLRHDRDAFLATVDPRATAFRTRQAAYLDALRDVPLASWTYQVDPTREQPRTAALDAERGTWWAPDVALRYALAGFDREPTLQPQGLTFVLRSGRWFVAADDDFATTGRRTARDLWDSGHVIVSRGSACLVLGHARRARLVQQLVETCDAAVPRVTAVWGRTWAQRVVVLVPDSAAELIRLVPEAGDLSQIAAVATAELVAPSTGYHPVGDRVLVNPEVFAELGSIGRRVVMTHEATHVASRAATGTQAPTWLVEGLADYVGYLGTGIPVTVAAQELRTQVRRGRVPTALPTDEAFDGARDDLAQTYEQSWLMVRLLADRYGQDGLLRLYLAIGADRAPGALARALQEQLRTTEADLVREWRADLVRRLA